jgi:hypothetical protein
MRSTRSSNDDARVPDPSILTSPAGQSRDLQGTTKLEYRSAREPALAIGERGNGESPDHDGRGLPMDELERWTRVGFERGQRCAAGER